MSMRTAISGMNAAQTDLSSTANNIANSSTVGFKGSRAEFSSLYALSAGRAGSAPGAGVRVSNLTQQFTQGDLAFTGNSLDLSINGDGFFVIQGQESTPSYTRAGAFQIDREGYVANAQGARLKVYLPTGNNSFSTGTLSDLRISAADAAPKATSNLEIQFNLPASGATTPRVTPFDAANANSYNFSNSATIYDSQGGAHVATNYYVKTANANEWQQYLLIDGQVVPPTNPTNPGENFVSLTFSPATGGLSVPANGLVTFTPFTPPAGEGYAPINLTLDIARSAQFGNAFSVSAVTQDGFTTGKLMGVSVDPDGVIRGSYTNGRVDALAQVAMARFSNPTDLRATSDSSWSETFESGPALIGAPGAGGLGQIQGGALENSNVDLTQQLVNMITAQRNFQANAKVISTADALAQTLINLR
jgi:flagellar hook protein FlgE